VSLLTPRPPTPPLFPYTTLFRSAVNDPGALGPEQHQRPSHELGQFRPRHTHQLAHRTGRVGERAEKVERRAHAELPARRRRVPRSEEHTSELQSRFDLVCRLLLE